MQPSRRSLTLVLAAFAVTGLAVLAGIVVVSDTPTSSSAGREASETVPSITLADLDTTTLAIARAGFCDAMGAEHVADALGGEPARAGGHAPGDRAQLTPDLRDVAHEHACSWSRPGARAQAWVFAPPVARAQARAMTADARKAAGCSVLRDAPAYGAVSLARACRTDQGLEVSWRGLFGDAWLTCSLRASGVERDALVERAGRWCAAVALTAAA